VAHTMAEALEGQALQDGFRALSTSLLDDLI
jgi:hypothetical protein